jgi:parvulin-like peptidyl-prolyl isomerase
MMRRFAVWLLVLPVTLPLARGGQDPKVSPPAQAAPANDVVVKVLGESITENQVLNTILQVVGQLAQTKQLNAEKIQQKNTLYYREALDTLIGTILLKNEAREKNIVADKAKIEDTFKAMKAQVGGEEKFQEALKMQGMTEAGLREQIETNLLCQQVIEVITRGLPPPTDADVRKFYDENPNYFQTGERVHAAHIFLKVDRNATEGQKAEIRKKLESIRAEILAKKITFAEAAAKNSEDKANASKGGDLGDVKRGDMVPPVENAIFGTPAGTLSQVVETEFGLHLIQVIEPRPPGLIPLEAVSAQIRPFLEGRARQEATRKHLEALKAGAKVEYVMSEAEWNKRHAGK